MSDTGVHQPLLTTHHVVQEAGESTKGENRYRGRCFCGWKGPYRKKAWEAGRDTTDHVVEMRGLT